MSSYISIAIDGPASSGKSTVSKQLAQDLSFTHIDTGAMYRSLTLKAIEEEVPFDDEDALYSLLNQLEISFQLHADGQHVYIDGVDRSQEIRSLDVTNNASEVSAHPKVRIEMVRRQREMADHQNVIMDGRDIGTYVLPHADYKFFLDASIEERARRRHKENMEKGIETSFERIKKEIEIRDDKDRNREFAPLKASDDAIIIDTSDLSIDQVMEKIKNKMNQ